MDMKNLEERFKRSTKILLAERRMREYVFGKKGKDVLATKLAEIDTVIEDITAMKDQLKLLLSTDQSEQAVQATLLDVRAEEKRELYI